MLAEKTRFVMSDLKPLIGTKVTSDTDTLLSGKYGPELRAQLEARGVLVFPGVNFSDEQQMAFTQTLGTQAYENNGIPDEKTGQPTAIFKVTLDTKINRHADYLKNSFYWHLDGSMSYTPILASILNAKHLPPEGAQTEFCNTYAAYDALPDSDKKAIADLKIVHSAWGLQRYTFPEPSFEQFKQAKAVPSATQPLVWTHRSGRKSLVLGATATHVLGMDPVESWELLVRLRDWATQPQFVYRHEWTLGDVVIWDNTGTLHRAMPYDPNSGRLLHRTMLAGEESFA